MINANQARKKAEEKLNANVTGELQELEKLIDNAIDEGQCQIYVNGTLRPETLNRLKELGYKIEVGGRYNEIDTVIKW